METALLLVMLLVMVLVLLMLMLILMMLLLLLLLLLLVLMLCHLVELHSWQMCRNMRMNRRERHVPMGLWPSLLLHL